MNALGLGADRTVFFFSSRLTSPVLPALLTALCHIIRSGEMNGVSLSNQWRWLGKWELIKVSTIFRTATGAGRLGGAYTTHGGPIGAPAASRSYLCVRGSAWHCWRKLERIHSRPTVNTSLHITCGRHRCGPGLCNTCFVSRNEAVSETLSLYSFTLTHCPPFMDPVTCFRLTVSSQILGDRFQ